MKQTLLLAFLFFSCIAYSQRTVENPRIGMSTDDNLKIEKVELRDTATAVWFHLNYPQGSEFSIPQQSFIQAVGSKEKLYVINAEGIKINESNTMSSTEGISYKLFFPKVDASVSKLDFGEDNEGGSWFIYDIMLKPELFKSIIPSAIAGNWFRSDNGQWEISLFDSVAIYKKQVWKYEQYTEKDGMGKISMKNGLKSITLYSRSTNDSTCMLGETPNKLIEYAHKANESVIPSDKEPYRLPLFKMDTVTYCGYIKGFSSRYPQRTGMLYVNDVLTGEQESHQLRIADDGSFKLKFVHSNPQGILVRLSSVNETVYLEPGKTTFHLIDNNNSIPHLFMGDCARLNTDMMKVKHIKSFDYNKMMEKIANSTSEQYKNWQQGLQQKDLLALKEFATKYNLSAKARQIKEMVIIYRYVVDILNYNMDAQSAWRKNNNNIPPDQREIAYTPTKLDSSYYSFLTNEMVNNPLAVITTDYYFFIDRLKYLDILTKGAIQSLTTADELREMVNLGYQLTDNEKDLAEKLKEVQSPEVMKLNKEFSEKYELQAKAFSNKYADALKELRNGNKEQLVSTSISEQLLSKGIMLTDNEKEYLKAIKEFDENPLIKKSKALSAETSMKISKFYTDRKGISDEIRQASRIKSTKDNIQKVLGIQLGFATDIMYSQDICRPIVSEMIPCSDEKLLTAQKEITTPFIAYYMALKNNETKAKLEANKIGGPKVNEVPKTAGDKVFDAIMEKYKGKVVYVDFWATWCAPCRSAIELIKPLKDEMAKENVVFVYISAPSSPKATYYNMIPTIKGEHYRASEDEWNTLCGMFNISGIPHYVLVGKDGKVLNSHLSHMQNEQLKTMLMKYIRE